jgi:hypothetical protein
MTYLARTVDDAIEWSRRQIDHPSQDWTNLCQSHVRQAMGVGAWAPSARDAWFTVPKSEKVSGGSPLDAPRGAAIYFTAGSAGHVALCIGKTTNDKCLSNDYVRKGRIDEAPRTFPRWGSISASYAGWSFWTPYGVLAPSSTAAWDGVVPPLENVLYAEANGVANKAAWRLACRLYDLGYYSGTPLPCYSQGYPVRAVMALEAARGWKVDGKYGDGVHAAAFG